MQPESDIITSQSGASLGAPQVAHPAFRVMKFLEDKIFCSLLLVLLSPLVLLIAVVIKLESPGPVFFKQRRGGLHQRPFHIYKFRTMLREAAFDRNVPQAKPKDPRFTRIGAFLRRNSLDEVPQLYNIVRGDMSMIGPRPHALFHDTMFASRAPGYERRFRVCPGMTGWAQVSGYRGLVMTDEDIQRRTDCDNYYIDHWTPALEISIMLKTLQALARATNAH